jgi:Ca-activated chloride channel family protein
VQGEFAFEMELQSSGTIHSIYSPTHPISFVRKDDHHATISFDKSMAVLDRDVQIFYTTGKDDIGLTMLQHKPDRKDGYFLMLLAPRADLGADKRVPRDMVFVLDTSGSMSDDGKIDQAKRALKFGLSSLKSGDRFALMNFATSVNTWQSSLCDATSDNINAGKSWVDKLEATGGTAINDALLAALEMQHQDRSRSFTIVFITDGKPTVGECQIEKILANFDHKAKENTRIFTFGVGYDLDAAFLDRLAELHKGTSTYVRPKEDMEIKVSAFFSQIHQPVLTDLKLKATSGPKLVEIYPPQLPDLFYGSQLVVLGRYQGTGKIAIQLTGNVGTASKEFNYDVDLKDHPDAKAYVEDLWARRKVGYMLDQIRNNGEKKELVDEVISLAKKYGIATPYTSYLVVPDESPRRFPDSRPVLGSGPGWRGAPVGQGGGGLGGGGLTDGLGGGGRGVFGQEAERLRLGDSGGKDQGKSEEKIAAGGGGESAKKPQQKWSAGGSHTLNLDDGTSVKAMNLPERKFAHAAPAISGAGAAPNAQAKQDQSGVELSIALNELKNQSQVTKKAQRSVLGRNLVDINGAWIDDQLKQETPKFEIKPMSNAYFKLLEKHPEMKEVLQLGNALVWIAPSGTAIVINPKSDKEEASDEEIDKLFAAKK